MQIHMIAIFAWGITTGFQGLGAVPFRPSYSVYKRAKFSFESLPSPSNTVRNAADENIQSPQL